MNKLERLEQEAFDDQVTVYDYYLGEDNLKGYYTDGNVAINTCVDTTAERMCVLAEELGHHHTSVGNILDMSDSGNRKQERQARLWGFNKLIGLTGLVRAYEAGCRNGYEIAEYLEVTEECLTECIEAYRSKYGIGVMVNNYYIMFIPHLAVGKVV
ncbi:ImmA/IrrE family metallo-endopeptidase [Massilistercora timonensis]|uniref:ImmA/IrrE family metallo-endopeptidase n=1 Tax=Massilistercora timonensis TaxID=2086584 RepID=UPI003AB6C057